MNYRHAFHAGNFADVLKHAILAQVLTYLGRKPTPFRVIDTHAGIGRYDLAGEDAQRTEEWRGGIGRLVGATLDPALTAFLAPYLAAVEADNPDGTLTIYPGSPCLTLRLLRREDRLMACELHPRDIETLRANLSGDRRAKALHLDGWIALPAQIPPPERRGLVLIDPPFEATDDRDRLTRALIGAWRKWPGGVYMAWFPVKTPAAIRQLADAMRQAGMDKALIAELGIGLPDPDGPLVSSAVALVNPPFTLADDLRQVLPALAKRLAGDSGYGRLHEVADGRKAG